MQETIPVTYEVEGIPIDGGVEIKKWVRNGLDKLAVGYADKFGYSLAKAKKALTASQIRNVFGEVRRIQMKMIDSWRSVEPAVLLLKPKLAYAAKRADSAAVKALEEVLTAGITEITNGSNDNEKIERFKRFADFFEAILAYHKAYGGKD